jgi:hypothetical protein
MFPVVELNKMVTPGPRPANTLGLHSAIAKRLFPPLSEKKLPIDLRNKDNRFDREDENEFKSQA